MAICLQDKSWVKEKRSSRLSASIKSSTALRGSKASVDHQTHLFDAMRLSVPIITPQESSTATLKLQQSVDSNESYGRNSKKICSGAGYPRLEVKTASVEFGAQHVICDEVEIDDDSHGDEVVIGDKRERVKRPSISSLKKAKYSRSLYSTGSAN